MGLLALLLGVGAPAWAQDAIPERYQRILPGTMKLIIMPQEVRGYAVRDPGMVELRPGPVRNTVYVISLERGITELLVFGEHGPIQRVKLWMGSSGDGFLMICEICKAFPEGNALWVESAGGGRLRVRGTAYTLEEARSVKQVLSWSRDIFSEVQLTERALRGGILQVNRELWRAGFLDAHVVVVGAQVVLTGRFKSDEDEARARATVAPYARWLEDRLGLPIRAPSR